MNAEHYEATAGEYHSGDEISNSKISDFLDDPAYFYAKHIERSIPETKRDYFDFGTATHEEILLGSFLGGVVEIPRDALDARGAKRGKAWLDFRDENAGKILLKTAELEMVLAMRDAVFAHPKAGPLLDPDREGEFEHSVRWTDYETRLDCRCRPDRLCKEVIVDLKTANDVRPKAFAKHAHNMGYHRQAAWYELGVESLVSGSLPFVFIAVRKWTKLTEPRPCTVMVYELDEEFELAGYEENRAALLRIKECMDSGDWSLPGSKEILQLSMPRYGKYENEWNLA